ncbi:probable polyamine oxidase 5 [Momordica charantia]|uniref:Probable polyamine oxidase 5 n=1 Tax=Momordica charantia TaxID=3673 RepID=A0A6J1DKV4_MOMCH|nr:probable polyamine oxidase 5 [Momordica charantia]
MVEEKPRIVIIGAGMAGLTAANKLYTAAGSKDLFELAVVEGGERIGGRINTAEFMGDRIEMGATWIHGIGGSPIHKIAEQINALHSNQPWECMDGYSDLRTTVAEGGLELSPATVDPISSLFKKLMDFAQGKITGDSNFLQQANNIHGNGLEKLSIGAFLRRGLDLYWVSNNGEIEPNGCGEWTKKSLEEAIFAMYENTQRTYTSAGELSTLDYSSESEYQMFPGEEITIAKGYLSVIESIASVLPPGLVQLGKKVIKIEWQPEPEGRNIPNDTQTDFRPVKLHFSDGSDMSADHVIVTVSLGVLKAGIQQRRESDSDSDSDSGLFNPPLPSFKTEAISRLGFGVVNKLFLRLAPPAAGAEDSKNSNIFPCLNFVFHRPDSELRRKKIPWWMRRTASLHPIYQNSSLLQSWFAGEEALHLEKLSDEEIINGVSTTIGNFLIPEPNSNYRVKFTKVLKSEWGSDPLFLGSYSYVAVGSSGEDLDAMAEPLPRTENRESSPEAPALQILFAGEATHRTHYSTTHGAHFSGLREANRLLHHYNYNCV